MVTLYSVSPNKNTPIAELSKKLEVRSASRGETVIEKDTVGEEMFFVVRGEAEVLHTLEPGAPAFATVEVGGFFGEGALLQRAECRSLLLDQLRTLSSLNFVLGAATGLAAVAVVAYGHAERAQSNSHEQADEHTAPQSPGSPPPYRAAAYPAAAAARPVTHARARPAHTSDRAPPSHPRRCGCASCA